MTVAASIAAGSLLALAGLHSWLGERLLVGPLLAVEPWPAVPIGRTLGRRTLRFAWHLTSLAWLGFATLVLQAGDAPAVAATVAGVLLGSGLVTLAAARGRHPAWVLFFTGGIAAAAQLEALGAAALPVLAVASGTAFGAVALLHVGWALGLRWGIAAALPTVDGKPTMIPPRWMTLAVALAVGVAAWLALGLGALLPPPPLARWLGFAGAAVLGVRTAGDLSTVGLFKRVRGTRFARWDDLLYTPLCYSLGACLLLLALRAG